MVAPDAKPDVSRRRLQVVLAARGGCRTELTDRVQEIARAAASTLGDRARVIVMDEIDEDPFPAANPLCRPFDAVLEVESGAELPLDTVLDALGDVGRAVDNVVHVDLSGALVGAPQAIFPCEPSALRYLYFMRRRAHTTRAEYLDYYFHQHSRFGLVTPNIAGYTQFHIDPDRSAEAARRLGLGSICCDSVSELHLESLESFFAGIGDGRLGMEAAADEATFVDRDNSVSICTVSTVVSA